nr:MAG: MC107L [Molluscum contagiosum virus]
MSAEFSIYSQSHCSILVVLNGSKSARGHGREPGPYFAQSGRGAVRSLLAPGSAHRGRGADRGARGHRPQGAGRSATTPATRGVTTHARCVRSPARRSELAHHACRRGCVLPDTGSRTCGLTDVPDARSHTCGRAAVPAARARVLIRADLSDARTRVFVRNKHAPDACAHVRVLSTGHDVTGAAPGSAAAFNTLHPSARTASAQESLRSNAQHAPGEAAAAGGCRAPALCPVPGRRDGAFSRARHRHVPRARDSARVPRASDSARDSARVPRARDSARVPRARDSARVPRARVPRARDSAPVRGSQRAPGATIFATGHSCVADAGQRAPQRDPRCQAVHGWRH